MPIRDEDLIQYLLGEADDALCHRVRIALAEDAAVAERLDQLRWTLGLLDSLKGAIEPPGDLVARTMLRIAADDAADDAADGGSVSDQSPTSEVHALPADSVQLRPTAGGIPHSAWRARQRAYDSVMITISIVALSCLILPMVLEARAHSRRLTCAEHLQELGHSLAILAQSDKDHRFPTIPIAGPRAFAGAYSLVLQDADLLPAPEILRCASLAWQSDGSQASAAIPTSLEFDQAGAEQQQFWRNTLGGHYAYSLGVVENGTVVGPRCEGRSFFAIMADAPLIEADRETVLAHDGRGTNILYEDGHVAFLSRGQYSGRGLAQRGQPVSREVNLPSRRGGVNAWPAALADHPFRNMDGENAAGLTPNDAALGPSSAPPLRRHPMSRMVD